jgi:hypothetical protein
MKGLAQLCLLLLPVLGAARQLKSVSPTHLPGGSVVRKDGQLALQLPSAVAFDEKSVALAEIVVEQGVPKPEDAKDMLVTLSVDPELRLKLHSTGNPEGGHPKGYVPLAWANYKNTVEKNGWGFLSVTATDSPEVAADLKMYAAGFLEGFSTTQQIRDFQHNANGLMAKDEQNHNAMDNIRNLFSKEIETIRSQAGMVATKNNVTVLSDANQPKDQWWRHAKFMFLQAWGILDAYNQHVDKVKGVPMSMVDLLILNADGETPELEMAYDSQEVILRQSIRDGDGDVDVDNVDDEGNTIKKNQTGGISAKNFLQKRAHTKRAHSWQVPDDRAQMISRARERRMQTLRNFDDKAWRKFKAKYGRCSALVRLAKNNTDLFVGHTTFSDYSEMNRIYKVYDLPLGGNGSRRMSFSSYPGVVGSTDDYYVMDTGLVVTETTVSMLSDEAFDKLDDNGQRYLTTCAS